MRVSFRKTSLGFFAAGFLVGMIGATNDSSAQTNMALCQAMNVKDCQLRFNGSPIVDRIEAPMSPGYTQVSINIECKYVDGANDPQTYNYACWRSYPMSRPPVLDNANIDKPTNQCGSIIEQERQVLRESIPLTGSSFFLSYSSDRAHAYAADRHANFSFAGAGSVFESVKVSTTLGSNSEQVTSVDPDTTSSVAVSWNGQDSSGNFKMTAETVVAKEEFYDHDEYGCAPFWDGTVICAGGTDSAAYATERQLALGGFRAKGLGLGGWTLSVNHFYDKVAKRLHFGSGGSRKVGVSAVSGVYTVPSEDGSEVYLFDSTGRHTSTKTGLTGSTKYSFMYDSQGRLTSITDAYSNVTTITRNSSGLMTGIQTPYGQVNTVSLDANGYLTEVTNPSGEKYEMTYYSTGGLLNTFKKPRGQVSTFVYDSAGRLSSDTNSAGQSWSISRLINGTNKTINMTSAEGRVTSAVISPNNENSSQSKVTLPSGYEESTTVSNASYETFTGSFHSSNQTYSSDKRFGNLARYQSAANYSWGNIGNLSVTRTDAVVYNNPSTPNPFDINTLISTITQGSKVTTSVYDGATKTFTLTSPVGRLSYVTIDSKERPIQTKRATFSPVNIAYDSNGRLSTVNHSARTTTYNYNSAGFVSSVVNAANETTSYTYDLAGRVLTQTLPDTRVIAYSYDANGNLTSITPPSSSAHAFTVSLKDLIGAYSAPSLGSGVLNTTYTYNNDKQVTQVVRPSGATLNYNYHATQGTLTSVTSGSATMSYWYDKGRVVGSVSPDNIYLGYTYSGPVLTGTNYGYDGAGTIVFGYDVNLNLTSTQVNYGTTYTYEYDNDELLKNAGDQTITRSSTTGFVTGTTLGSATETYTYDSTYGEVASYQGKFGTQNHLHEVYTRDALGRIATRTLTVGGAPTSVFAYTYDNAGRLTAVTRNGAPFGSYAYDSNSNRTSATRDGVTETGTYDAQDRILTWGSNSYAYNLNGERTQKVDSSTSPASVSNYTWDSFGNLKSVQIQNGTTYYFKYDGQNRLVKRLTGTTVTHQFVYLDQTRLAAVLDATGATVMTFIWGTKPNVPEYMIKNGEKYKFFVDHLGSVRRVIRMSDNTIAQQITYDEFGRVLADWSPGFQPFGYAGGNYIYQAHIVRFGARFYDPEVGRWLSKDPILFAGGDTNLYGYVENDPINWVDPSGLVKIKDDSGGGGSGVRIPWPSGGGSLPSGGGGNTRPGSGSSGNGSLSCPASAPAGRGGSPIIIQPGTNSATSINGINYHGHGIDSMQGRGIPPSAIENAIKTGTRSGVSGGTVYYDPVNNIRVFINNEGLVTGVRHGK